jgi:hypothetical protein
LEITSNTSALSNHIDESMAPKKKFSMFALHSYKTIVQPEEHKNFPSTSQEITMITSSI